MDLCGVGDYLLCKFFLSSCPLFLPLWVPRNDTHANTLFFSLLQFFVETAGKTLEELKQIFEAPNPRKASTRKTKVAMAEGGQVVHVD